MPSKKTPTSDMTKMAKKTPAKTQPVENKKASKKQPVKEPVVEAPPAQEEPAPEVVEEKTPASEAEVEWVTAHTEILKISEQIAELEKRRRALTKTCDKWARKMIQKAKKTGRKKNAQKGNKPPSGFAKPQPVSAALCKFLNVPTGTEMARTQVTKQLTDYIAKNNMQNPNNKREIVLDAPLAELLGVPLDQKLTYFSLQQYMVPHYSKPVAAN